MSGDELPPPQANRRGQSVNPCHVRAKFSAERSTHLDR